jgi:fimbrial chaperone protein
MRKPWRLWKSCSFVTSAGGLLFAAVPCGAQVLISPVVVEMTGAGRAVAVEITLSDRAKAPIRLQAELLRWDQDVRGAAVTEPSDDLLISPPIADLQPGDKQVFRVALRGARRGPEELAYRLVLEDIAALAGAGEGSPGMNIQFRMRYDLPVLVAPAGPVVNALRWKPCPPPAAVALQSAADVCVRVLNAGNRRVKVQTLTLSGANWQQALTLKDGVNVLAGAEREWRVALPGGQSGAVRGVQVQTERGETLQAEADGF